MSESCEGSLGKGQEVVDLVRIKGYSNTTMDKPLKIECDCGEKFLLETYEGKCPSCGIVYGVTPCHADSVENVRSAGKDY
ncbi:MAG: hypothetical protein PHQ32_04140 [Firmicutes bacterium]|nr:hypothetical protein [Bacillota bacterium]